MSKKLLPAFFLTLLITSCQKTLNSVYGDPNAAVKTLVFTANSTLPVKVVVYIARNVTLQIDDLTLYSVNTPYTYTSTKIQKGDAVSITITGKAAFTASLTIDGVTMPSAGSGLDISNLNYTYWTTIVP
jgi:hypothetical protein